MESAPLVAARVARNVRVVPAELLAPRRPGVARVVAHAGVEAQAGHYDVGVAAVRVDGDPAAGVAAAPVHQVAGRERRAQKTAAVERVAHGARTVVSPVEPAGES